MERMPILFLLTCSLLLLIKTPTEARSILCNEGERSTLLSLRSELVFNSLRSKKLVAWNSHNDCCRWDGIECNRIGRVIGLELDYDGISSGINGSSSLFRLRNLKKLNLAGNSLDEGIQIPKEMGRLTSLTELDLSGVGFGGLIPSTFAELRKLAVVDLSENFLTGAIPSLFSELRELVSLDLSDNMFTTPLPSFRKCIKLKNLNLDYNQLEGSLPNSQFERLPALQFLDLSYNRISGRIPHSIFRLPSLQRLYLSYNRFSGQINEFPVANLTNLVYLGLGNNLLNGSLLPFPLGLPAIEDLVLSGNRLSGPIPEFLFRRLPSLTRLDLSSNLFTGRFKLKNLEMNSDLIRFSVSHNNLSVDASGMNLRLFRSSSLRYLSLASCNLDHIPAFIKHLSLLKLDLSSNRIAGEIPNWIWGVGYESFLNLNLSDNMFQNIEKPYQIPPIVTVDLHSNRLEGELPPPPPNAVYLDYSENNFDKPIPPSHFQNITSTILFLSIAKNSITGPIPSSLCNATELRILDLSLNNMGGSIRRCFLMNKKLEVLNLRRNNFFGVVHDEFPMNCSLKVLDLNDNNLRGKIPKSLANCRSLTTVNVGYNNMEDNFPCMLWYLHTLVLRSNAFHGELKCHKSWPNLQILDISNNNFGGSLARVKFSMWRGMIPDSEAELRRKEMQSKRDFSNFGNGPSIKERTTVYQVALYIKARLMELVKINPEFTTIDFSCNSFEGEIPDGIGDLAALYLLNFSRNGLLGSIPASIGKLSSLESLDLSHNQLTGIIPVELAKLTFLSYLDVSYNKLVGMIPTGPQLQTFSESSFQGNLGLCGAPTKISCGHHTSPPEEGSDEEEEEEEIGWGYVSASLGFAVGLGVILWASMCNRTFRRVSRRVDVALDDFFDGRARRRRRRTVVRQINLRNRSLRNRIAPAAVA